MLTHAYNEVGYVSPHAYYQEHDGNAVRLLTSAVDMTGFIVDNVTDTVVVGTLLHSPLRHGNRGKIAN